MLLRKHQYIALVSGSLSMLALVNCSDSDTAPGADGGSDVGKAGAGQAGAGVTAGATGKAGASSSHGGAKAQAGEAAETAGDSSEGGGGSGGKASAGAGAGAGGTTTHAGAANVSDAGEGGEADDGGAAGAGGHTGPHVGAILKYSFDEGAGSVAVDSSGSGLGLNGTLALATAWTTQGRNGAGLALSGGVSPTTYVTLPPGIFKNVKSTTIATWVKLGVAGVGWNRIFDVGNAAAGVDTRFMYLSTNAVDGVHFSTFGGSQAREAIVASNTLLPQSVWKHVAVTIAEGGKRSIYLDGFPAADATTVDVAPSELEPLSAASWLGKSRFDADAGLNAALDEFTVYDRVLAPAEIATLAAPQGDYTRIPFDEAAGTTSADTSTRAVNATLNGDVTWASGRLGAAVQLSGAAQYVTLSGNPLAGCTDSLTVAMWVKEITAAPFARLLDFGNANNFMFLTPNGDSGNMRLSIFTPTKETVVLSPLTLPADSTWHHVAIVVAPLLATIYVDGAFGGSTALPVTPAVLGATTENWLGKSRFSATDAYFNGAFDEVRISCRAYTADEIKSLAFH